MHNNYDIELGKIEDAGMLVSNGRIDRHWNDVTPKSFKLVGESLKDDTWALNANMAVEEFGLRSLEFGNWMTQQDRSDFMYASIHSLDLLSKLLNVDHKTIGFNGRLSLALGARGRGGGAMAHYERSPYSVINLTKPHGQGTLGHEYGHALDNIISFYTGGKSQDYVSGGDSIRTSYDSNIAKNGNYFEQQFEEMFKILYWNNGEATDFQKNLRDYNKYWNQRNEVFARTFEVFLRTKLKATSYHNVWLVQNEGTYIRSNVYPSERLVSKASKHIDNIINKAFDLIANKRTFNLSGIEDFKGLSTTIVNHANLKDTLDHASIIAKRDYLQVEELAKELEGDSIEETSENIWNYIRENITYKLDNDGFEELRTPIRTIVDGIGDCDDFTILTSAILLNLGISHEYRVAAYDGVGQFQHIYVAAFDQAGNKFIIDAVPQIPHFNYEENYVDLKTVNMELVELSGLGALEDHDDLEMEQRAELINDLNEPFSLEGIDDFDEDEDELEEYFLQGFEVVDDENEADIVLSGSELPKLIDRGILAEINKAKLTLMKEFDTPTILSQSINVNRELEVLESLMSVWDDDSERKSVLANAIETNSPYSNFYKSILLSIDKLEEENDGLDGFEEEIYLARTGLNDIYDEDELDGFEDDFDLEDLEDELDDDELDGLELGSRRSRRRAKRKAKQAKRKTRRKARRAKRKRKIKKIFKKVKKGLKKVVKAIVRYNPATILMRNAVLLSLKLNLFKAAEKMIYGYISESEAQQMGLDMENHRNSEIALRKSLKFFTKIGGKEKNFKSAIAKGRARKKTGLSINGLGEPVTATAAAGTTAASVPFWKKVGKFLKKINPFKKRNKGGNSAEGVAADSGGGSGFSKFVSAAAEGGVNALLNDGSNPNMRVAEQEDQGFVGKAKEFVKSKKGMIVIGGIVAAIIGFIVYTKVKDKNKRKKAGLKGARTRKRNKKRLSGVSNPVGYLPSPRKRRTVKKKVAPKKKNLGSAKKDNAERLRKMHQIARKMRADHPKTKYSTLLKKAAKQI